MYNDWVVCELVKVWYRLYKDGGSGGDGNQLAGSRRSVGRQERVGVLADDLNLCLSSVKGRSYWKCSSYLRCRGDNASVAVLGERFEVAGEVGFDGEGGLY